MAKTQSQYISDWTDAEFADQLKKSDKPVVVDFWADWCAPCHVMAPILDEIADELHDSFTFAKMDVDANPQVPSQYFVLSIPTLIVFKEGKVVAQHSGVTTKAALKKLLDKAR